MAKNARLQAAGEPARDEPLTCRYYLERVLSREQLVERCRRIYESEPKLFYDTSKEVQDLMKSKLQLRCPPCLAACLRARARLDLRCAACSSCTCSLWTAAVRQQLRARFSFSQTFCRWTLTTFS